MYIEGRFQKEINVDNPLGSGGKLALSFAVLLKVLWAGSHHSYAPSKLKVYILCNLRRYRNFYIINSSCI